MRYGVTFLIEFSERGIVLGYGGFPGWFDGRRQPAEKEEARESG